jgi:hypothetical protein
MADVGNSCSSDCSDSAELVESGEAGEIEESAEIEGTAGIDDTDQSGETEIGEIDESGEHGDVIAGGRDCDRGDGDALADLCDDLVNRSDLVDPCDDLVNLSDLVDLEKSSNTIEPKAVASLTGVLATSAAEAMAKRMEKRILVVEELWVMLLDGRC